VIHVVEPIHRVHRVVHLMHNARGDFQLPLLRQSNWQAGRSTRLYSYAIPQPKIRSKRLKKACSPNNITMPSYICVIIIPYHYNPNKYVRRSFYVYHPGERG